MKKLFFLIGVGAVIFGFAVLKVKTTSARASTNAPVVADCDCDTIPSHS